MRWCFLICLCIAFPALAGDQPTIKSGIRTLTITPPAMADKPVVADDTDAATLQKPAAQVTGDGEAPPYIADLDSTVAWPHLRGLLLPPETAEFQVALAALRENPGGVPPQGLLYGATALVNTGKLRDAALYQQAALLRTAFDARRFEDGVAWRRHAKSIAGQGAALNDVVYPILLQSPAQLVASLQALMAWDKATRYAYALPDAVQARPRKDVDMEKVLAETRAEFVARWLSSASVLWPDQAAMLKASQKDILN